MPTPMLNGLNILVVEDDPLNAEALTELLTILGAQIAAVFSRSSDTLQYFQRNSPDIVLLDYRLEDGTADAVIDDMRRRKLPFVVVSGCLAQQLPANLSPAITILKPYLVNTLLIAMAAALDEVDTEKICAVEKEQPLRAMTKINSRAGDFLPLQQAF